MNFDITILKRECLVVNNIFNKASKFITENVQKSGSNYLYESGAFLFPRNKIAACKIRTFKFKFLIG